MGVKMTLILQPGALWCFSFIIIFGNSSATPATSCDVFGRCSQVCVSFFDRFNCSCVNGFTLGKDGHGCYPTDKNWKLLYTAGDKVGVISFSNNGSKLHHLNFTKQSGLPTSLSCDTKNDIIYWTSVSPVYKTIYKSSLTTGLTTEIILDVGMDNPESVAFDWITGNIYLADSKHSQIIICSNASNICAVLVNGTVDNLRDMALSPNFGIIFWINWGNTPAILQAGMNGAIPHEIISTGLKWPNSVAVDQGNARIYWGDAQWNRIESSRFDGTDRSIILSDGKVKHPFAVDIFGDRIYWSEFNSDSIEFRSADKFTGLDDKLVEIVPYVTTHTPVKKMAISYSGNQPITRPNACQKANCSHICALGPVDSFKCLCPQGMFLDEHYNTCIDIADAPALAVVYDSAIVVMTINSTKMDSLQTRNKLKAITAVVYNPVNHTLILSVAKKIYEYHLNQKYLSILVEENLYMVQSLDIDVVGENLYWADTDKNIIEVMSFRTGARLVLHRNMTNIRSLLVVSDHSSLYIATSGGQEGKIYKMPLNGANIEVISKLNEGTQPMKHLILAYFKTHGYILWAGENGNSSRVISMSLDGEHNSYISLNIYTWLSVLATHSPLLYFMTIDGIVHTYNPIDGTHLRRFSPESNDSPGKMTVVSRDVSHVRYMLNLHDCAVNNFFRKKCSHLCLLMAIKFLGECRCPLGMALGADHITCISLCAPDQFTCQDGKCIPKSYVCDGYPSCSGGEDEKNCHGTICPQAFFKCGKSDICIRSNLVCDRDHDCLGGEDEYNCTTSCNKDREFTCKATKKCIPKSFQCDGVVDCPGDDSDEEGCDGSCAEGRFRCGGTHCIPSSLVCDNHVDCGDGSDEIGCNKDGTVRDTTSKPSITRETFSHTENKSSYSAIAYLLFVIAILLGVIIVQQLTKGVFQSLPNTTVSWARYRSDGSTLGETVECVSQGMTEEELNQSTISTNNCA